MALAQTLNEEEQKKDGAVKAVRNSNGNPEYVFARVANKKMQSSAATRWRNLRKIGERKIQRYFTKKCAKKTQNSRSG